MRHVQVYRGSFYFDEAKQSFGSKIRIGNLVCGRHFQKKQCFCVYVVYQLFVHQQIRVLCIYIQLRVVLHKVQLILPAVSYYLHICKIKRFGILIVRAPLGKNRTQE